MAAISVEHVTDRPGYVAPLELRRLIYLQSVRVVRCDVIEVPLEGNQLRGDDIPDRVVCVLHAVPKHPSLGR